MIGIDANVLVRFLTKDDPRDSPVAQCFMMERSADDPVFISLVTLAETVWTLRSHYRWDAADVETVVGTLLSLDSVVIQEPQAVSQALDACRSTKCDLPDALVAVLGRRHGCAKTVTFDRQATRIAGMEAIA